MYVGYLEVLWLQPWVMSHYQIPFSKEMEIHAATLALPGGRANVSVVIAGEAGYVHYDVDFDSIGRVGRKHFTGRTIRLQN